MGLKGALASMVASGAASRVLGGATSNTIPTLAAPASLPPSACDFSALLLEDWVGTYLSERNAGAFESVSLFCEIKLRELIEITTSLHALSDSTPDPAAAIAAAAAGASSSAAATAATAAGGGIAAQRAAAEQRPSKVRTAVCIDLLDILIASIVHPTANEGSGGGGGGGTDQQPSSSRQALGQLLLKLRDELVRAIYVQPVPAHLFLQYQVSPQPACSSARLELHEWCRSAC
jgi:hypothetical protein